MTRHRFRSRSGSPAAAPERRVIGPGWRVLWSGDPALATSTRLADARAAIAAVPTDAPVLAEARAGALAFCDAEPNALDRHSPSGHLFASALVVDPVTRRALLLLRRDRQRWVHLGAHADGDANLAAVALRAAARITGLNALGVVDAPMDLRLHVVEPQVGVAHRHVDVRFLAVAPSGALPRPPDGGAVLHWFRLDEVARVGEDAGLERLVVSAYQLCSVFGTRNGRS